MKLTTLFSREWCDIVFEHRNKAYGAYQLRAQTGRRYCWSLLAVMLTAALLAAPGVVMVCLDRQPKPKPEDFVKKITRFDGVRIKEARPVRRPPKKAAAEIDDKAPADDFKEIPEVDNTAVSPRPEDVQAMLDKIVDLPVDSAHILSDESRLKLAEGTEQTTGVVVDSIAQYPGGIKAFMRWLHESIVYPPECIRRKYRGKVVVAFIVEPSGQVTHPRIELSADPMFNREVLRVISLMQPWQPAQRNGQPIRSQVTLPVEFDLSEEPVG